jgi:hypothetical protein
MAGGAQGAAAAFRNDTNHSLTPISIPR